VKFHFDDAIGSVRWIYVLPFLIPPLYLAVILWLQPGDRMGPPEGNDWLGQLLYDDWDESAMALRGLNGYLGRMAGDPEEPNEEDLAKFDDTLNDANRPLRSRYFLEYPHASLLVFELGYVWQSVETPPAAVLDGSYRNLVRHRPRNGVEARIWRQMRWAGRTYLLLMTVCQLGLMTVLYTSCGRWAGVLWLTVLPAALYFALNRFDIVPVLLTAVSLAFFSRRWWIVSAVFLGGATAFKVYPVLLAPLLVRYLWDRRAAALVWPTVFTITLGVFLLPPLLVSGWDAFWAPYQFQLNRQPFPPTIYGYILPNRLEGQDWWAKGLRLGGILFTVGAVCLRKPAGWHGLLRRGALVLIALLLLAVIYSPQWILWLSPLLVPLAKSDWKVGGLIVALDLVTYVTFPLVMGSQTPDDLAHAVQAPLAYLRFAILGLLLYVLTADELRDRAISKGQGVEP
jgi:hypothetical protein